MGDGRSLKGQAIRSRLPKTLYGLHSQEAQTPRKESEKKGEGREGRIENSHSMQDPAWQKSGADDHPQPPASRQSDARV